jgi:hypothetical protein
MVIGRAFARTCSYSLVLHHQTFTMDVPVSARRPVHMPVAMALPIAPGPQNLTGTAPPSTRAIGRKNRRHGCPSRQAQTEGLDAVLTRKKRETPPIEPIFDGKRQAQLIALACSKPPAGHARWTIRLLAEHVVERKIVETAHFNTVGRALKKITSNRT